MSPSSPESDQLAHGRQRGVEEQQMADHQPAVGLRGGLDELARVRGARRQRLLDEDVLAGLERAQAERVMRGDAGGHGDRIQRRIVEQVVEVAGEPRLRVLRRIAVAVLLREVAAPRELGHAGHVAYDVGTPVAQADNADAHRHSLTTLAFAASGRAGGVAEVDHELRAVDEVGVVDRPSGS